MQILRPKQSTCAPSLLMFFACILLLLWPSATRAQAVEASADRVVLKTQALTSVGGAVEAGALPSSQPIQLVLTLTPTPERVTALNQLLSDLVDPRSSSYHQWIAPGVFASRYGATDAQIAEVTAWAQGQGLTVGTLSPSGMRVEVSGAAAQVQRAFGIGLHRYQVSGASFYGTPDQPNLPAAIDGRIASVAGLDDLPVASAFSLQTLESTGVATMLASGSDLGTMFLASASAIDANASSILEIASTTCLSELAPATIEQYRLLFRQAAAQGMTVLAASACGRSGSFPASFAEVTAITTAGNGDDTDAVVSRPTWQAAMGLPAGQLRVEPDLASASLEAFARTIAGILSEEGEDHPGSREGNLNAKLYEIATIPDLYQQPDRAVPGTWETATGLGMVDLKLLLKVFPRGTAASYTSFNASSYAPTHGANVSLTAVVTSGSGGAVPGGTVSFQTGSGVVVGTATLDGTGTAVVTTNILDGGNQAITANYSGNGTYAASASTASTISVQPEPSQLSAVVSTNNTVGESFTVTVTDTVSYGRPAGTITAAFLSHSYTGTLVPGTGASSTVSIAIPASTVGTGTISITCVGSANYTCYNPLTVTVTISKATPVLQYRYSPNPVSSGQTVSLSASLAAVGTAGVPTGNVRFLDNTTLLNAGTLANGVATATGTLTTAASHVLSAAYDGDASYLAVTATIPQTTGAQATTTALTSSASTVAAGVAIILTAQVATAALVNGAATTGSVAFLDGATLLGTVALNASVASLSTSSLSASTTHIIVAVYAGDSNYATSTSPAITLNKGAGLGSSTTAPSVSPSAPSYGTALTFAANVNATSGSGSPTGMVQFLAGTTVLCSAKLAISSATCSPGVAPAAGALVVTASYSGDTSFAASTSPSSTVTIGVAAATFAPTLSSATAISGAAVAVSAIVGLPVGSITPPTGAVTVTVSEVPGAVYTGALVGVAGSNTAKVNISIIAPAAGTYSVIATCTGNTSYTCVPVTFSLKTTGTTKPSTTLLSILPSTPLAGQTVTLTAKISGGSDTSAPTGTVRFLDGTTVLGSSELSGSGTSSFTSKLTGAAHTLFAVYSGDSEFATSSSAGLAVTPATVSGSIVLSSNVASTVAGFGVVLSAQVMGLSTAGAVPTGAVGVWDSLSSGVAMQIGSFTLSGQTTSSAGGSFTTTTLKAGAHSLYVVYAGDANFAAATSAPISVTVADYSVGFSPASLILTQGASGQATLTLVSGGGFSGTVTFACAGAGVSCGFSPALVSVGGTTVLTVTTTSAATASARWPGPLVPGGAFVLAALLCGLVPGRRRRTLPRLLAVLLALGLAANLGCGTSSSASSPGTTSGTPLGTSVVTISTSGTQGGATVLHSYPYQLTVQ